jgi:hypothetical protein
MDCTSMAIWPKKRAFPADKSTVLCMSYALLFSLLFEVTLLHTLISLINHNAKDVL